MIQTQAFTIHDAWAHMKVDCSNLSEGQLSATGLRPEVIVRLRGINPLRRDGAGMSDSSPHSLKISDSEPSRKGVMVFDEGPDVHMSKSV